MELKMAAIQSLPPELIFDIATHLTHVPEKAEAYLSAFARVNRHFYDLVDPFLYGHAVKEHTFYLLHWAAEHGNLRTLNKALAAGADPSLMRESPWPFKQTEADYRPINWRGQNKDIIKRALAIRSAADGE